MLHIFAHEGSALQLVVLQGVFIFCVSKGVPKNLLDFTLREKHVALIPCPQRCILLVILENQKF